jgi:hypothetical protein
MDKLHTDASEDNLVTAQIKYERMKRAIMDILYKIYPDKTNSL